jgi:hypothetical protein
VCPADRALLVTPVSVARLFDDDTSGEAHTSARQTGGLPEPSFRGHSVVHDHPESPAHGDALALPVHHGK